jgi:hypothetical protein
MLTPGGGDASNDAEDEGGRGRTADIDDGDGSAGHRQALYIRNRTRAAYHMGIEGICA